MGLPGDMDCCSSGFTDFFNLAAFFANNGPTLAGWNQQVQIEAFLPLSRPVTAISAVSSFTAFQGLAYEGVGLENRIRWTVHSYYPLLGRGALNLNLSSRLISDRVHNFSSPSNNGPCFRSCHNCAQCDCHFGLVIFTIFV